MLVKTTRSSTGEKVASASYPQLWVSWTRSDPSGLAAKMSKVGYRAQTYPRDMSGGGGQASSQWWVLA